MRADFVSSNALHKQWPQDSVGSKMTAGVPTAKLYESVQDVLDNISQNIESFDIISNVYVLDDEDWLVGIVSLRDLYSLPRESS